MWKSNQFKDGFIFGVVFGLFFACSAFMSSFAMTLWVSRRF